MEQTPTLIDRLNDEADLCRNDGADDIGALLSEAACAVDYYSAASQQRAPLWVPSRIRLPMPLRGDFPFGHNTMADAGDHDCDCNKWGAVSVRASNGQMLGVKPAEFHPLAWRRNEKD